MFVFYKNAAKEHDSNIIPQEILFAYQKEQARLSPDGQMLAYLAPSPDHVLNVVSSVTPTLKFCGRQSKLCVLDTPLCF